MHAVGTGMLEALLTLYFQKFLKLVTNLQLIDSDRQQKQECIWCEAEEKG